MFTRKMIVGIIVAMLVTNTYGDVIRVPQDQPTIQDGINAANDGDTVLVADDTYTGDRNVDIWFGNRQITVCSLNGPENCIIDCEESKPGFRFESGGDEHSILDGFTITNATPYGIRCITNSSPLIKNCIINNCYDGIRCHSSSPTISGCEISDSMLFGLSSSQSSSNPTFSNSILRGNHTGVYCEFDSDAIINNCLIVENGIAVNFSSSGNLTISNCTITGNENGLICGRNDSVATVNSCIFWDNFPKEIYSDYAVNITVKYCDVKDGRGRVEVPEENLTWSNNIDADPLFVDMEDGDFHLQQFSPCIDAGDPDPGYEPGTTDIDGQPRKNRIVDIGADEAGYKWYVYVDASGEGTGLSWEDAFTSIQDAIDSASAAHDDQIYVAEGTYSESIDFKGKSLPIKKVQLNEVADAVINPGDTSANVVTFDSGEDAKSILSGFVLTGGKYGVYCGNSSSPKILNCIIKANSDSGVYLNGAGTVEIRNDTIIDNSVAGIYVASGDEPSVTNCIVWNNNDNDLDGCSATYSCISNCDDVGDPSITHNICSNPLFVDPGNGDYHLGIGSPCINTGNPDGDYAYEEDIYNGPRLQEPCVDMGADEADPEIWTSESVNITLQEGETGTETLTIGNSGTVDLHFDIWPSNKEALEIFGAEMEEGYSLGYEVESSENEIILEYDFSEPVITNDGIYDHFTMEDLNKYEQVGAPIVPMRTVMALVPYGKKVIDIKLRILNKEKLPDKYYLPPAQQGYPISFTGKREPTRPDPAIYGSNKSWPGTYYKNPTNQSKRGYQLYLVKLFPVQYQPKLGKVSYVSKLRLTIKLTDKTTETILRPTRELKLYLAKTVDNPKAIGTYPLVPVGKTDGRIIMSAEGAGSDFVPGQPYDYIIITNKYLLEAAPEPWNFQRLRDSKIARGLTAAIVTTEWIYDEYAGTGEDNQALIRNFLIDAYYWHGSPENQYALLGGSDEIVPARKFYHWNYHHNIPDYIPCDMYYAFLDANCTFDGDGDGKYGEYVDGPGGDDVDLSAEIYIGRAGVKSIENVSNFVKKTLTYNATIGDYLLRVSMVAQDSWTLEYIRLLFENHSSTDLFDFDTSKNLYDKDYPPDGWKVNQLVDLMNNGVHVINHIAHSGPTCIGRFTTSNLSQLINEDYYFIYSQGCHPGAFDRGSEQCFAEQVTVKPHGAFAVIMNANLGYTTHSPNFKREFWDRVLHYDPIFRILEVGRANQESKETYFVDENYEESGWNRWHYFQLNTFGDPEQQFILGQTRDSAWLEAEPASGTINRQDSMDIDINFNAESLAPGTYDGGIIIVSNDYLNPTVTVPATMTVLQKPPAVTPYDVFKTTRQRAEELFVPESMTYTLTNNGTTSLSWTALSTEDWTDITPNTGNLEPSQAVDVVISLNQNAYDLPEGSYYCNINFTNTSTGNVHKRVVILKYVDYFTEVFDSASPDIQYQTLTFYPDASYDFYSVCRQSTNEFPTDPIDGNILELHGGVQIYREEEIVLSGQKQVSLYGESYESLYVLGNGIITFESDPDKRHHLMGDFRLDLYFGSPIISGLCSWLAPWDGGNINYKQLEDRIAVTFEDVPELKIDPGEPNNLNSFQVELFFDGRIRITHLNLALYWPSQGESVAVGLSEGRGVPDDFIESDLSEYSSSCPGVRNTNKNTWYMSIQDAIDDSDGGDFIEVLPDTYQENVDFDGKAITLSSSDPTDWGTVETTIIDGGTLYGILFNSQEDESSVLTGFTITNSDQGIALNSSPTIKNCIIEGNTTGIRGLGANAYPHILNSKIRNNDTGIKAEAMRPTIKNNWIYGNDYGIKIFVSNTETLIHNNTIVDNSSYGIYIPFGPSPDIRSCIIWNDNADDLYNCNATYSCIEDCDDVGNQSVTHNMCNNPEFVDADENDFHLDSTSPCIDAGDPTGDYTGQTDIDGEVRVFDIYSKGDGIVDVDMGADEIMYFERWYVKPDGDDYQDGKSWATAFKTISQGISAACDNDLITVAEGTYAENINFSGYAITIQSVDPMNWNVVEATVIDGSGSGSVVTFNNGETSYSVLDGITVANGSSYQGGGIYINNSSPIIRNCVIRDNYSGSFGGGMYNIYSSPTISRCIFHDNESYNDGAGIYNYFSDMTVANSLFVKNDAGYNAGAFNNINSSATIVNCTFSENTATSCAGAIYNSYGNWMMLTNCILWGDTVNGQPNEIYDNGCVYVNYCDIEGGWYGIGNIDADPQFADPVNNNYHLASDSPCIDVGDSNGTYSGQVDIDGDDRVIDIDGKGDGIVDVDMGVDEYKEEE